ncbi:NAD(P)/FAD-dependent oxidoreductase [Deinococcus roseus]|uniref:NADH dehydrogenase n=1 Tax=Deinococcus roseus TaxID=392414 RepID=A0ABQ2CY52_9DEIO|nr:FAD-dependent oxidoreductase [Deinococcus roseus]GGJ25392.1 NADH dehydrogenase [Deinococcus roseus]
MQRTKNTTRHNSAPVRVVLLGSGYTSIHAYRSLVRRLRPRIGKDLHITLITRDTHHAFHGWTGDALAGYIPVEHTLTPLECIFPLAQRMQGMVEGVDLQHQQVQVKTESGIQQVPYDHLVIGLGSSDPFDRIQGLAEHGFCLKSIHELHRLRTHLIARLQAAQNTQDTSERERLLHFTLIGGGYAGVEIAAALRGFFEQQVTHHPILQTCVPRIELIHAHEELLPELLARYPRLQRYALQQLQDLHIQVIPGTRIQKVKAGCCVTSTGATLPAGMVIATAGISLGVLKGTEMLPRDERKRLRANDHMQVQGHGNLWTAGDIANIRRPFQQGPCPTNALWAIMGGMHAGDNLARAIQRKPLRPFWFPGLGQSASFGPGRAIAELCTLQFTGQVAFLMRLGFFLMFMPHLPYACLVLKDWLRLRQRLKPSTTLKTA